MNVTGHSWGQAGSVDRVEYRIDGGEWIETTYSATPSEIGALTPFTWHILMDTKKMSSGNHTIEVHSVSGEWRSLPVFSEFSSNSSNAESDYFSPVILGVVVLFALGWATSIALSGSMSPASALRLVEKSLLKRGNDDSTILVAEIIGPTSDDLEG